MKKYLFWKFDSTKHQILQKELIWWSRPRILVRNIQNHHVYILKSYSYNARELWVELFASLLWNKISWISVQKASITVIPQDFLNKLELQIPESTDNLKPLVILIQNAFPSWYETDYWYKILWLAPRDIPSLDTVFEKISQKYSGYWRDEKILQSYTDMLIFDALIWNMDRHLENWWVHESKQIFLEKKKEFIRDTVRFTTLFDHGSAWLFELEEEKVKYYLSDIDRYEKEYILNTWYSLLNSDDWWDKNIFSILKKAYSEIKWKKYIKKSIEKISNLCYIDIAEVIFKMPEDNKETPSKREKIDYSRDRKELLLRWIILRQKNLKNIIK